jgi:hypothetical protein
MGRYIGYLIIEAILKNCSRKEIMALPKCA